MAFSGHLNPVMCLAEGLLKPSCDGDNDNNSNKNENDVCIITIDYGVKKIQSKCEALGIQLVGLDIRLGEDYGLDSEKAIHVAAKSNVPFPFLADQSQALMDEALAKFQPDVIVSDFVCLASQEYARTHNIPLVINWPGPLEGVKTFLQPVINIDNNRYIAVGGLFVSYVKCTIVKCAVFGNLENLGTLADRIRNNVMNNGNSLVLLNSFWGLETPSLLPPNIVPVGPIMKPLSKEQPDIFSQLHPELHDFITKARGKGKKILLVTTGSMVQLDQWLVELLFRAFSQLQDCCSIVWSLKEPQQEFVPDIENQNFYFSSWLPQPMLLAGDDLVDGVLTHCGWGGTMECIAGGKPVVVLPFAADQMANAKLLLNAGCATTIGPIPPFNMDSRSSYKSNSLNANTITEGCRRLLTDPQYLEAAKRLQALSTAPGLGCTAACDRIEHAGRHGIRHLSENNNDTAPTHANRLTGHRPFLLTLVFCAMTAAAAKAVVVLALRPKTSSR